MGVHCNMIVQLCGVDWNRTKLIPGTRLAWSCRIGDVKRAPLMTSVQEDRIVGVGTSRTSLMMLVQKGNVSDISTREQHWWRRYKITILMTSVQENSDVTELQHWWRRCRITTLMTSVQLAPMSSAINSCTVQELIVDGIGTRRKHRWRIKRTTLMTSV